MGFSPFIIVSFFFFNLLCTEALKSCCTDMVSRLTLVLATTFMIFTVKILVMIHVNGFSTLISQYASFCSKMSDVSGSIQDVQRHCIEPWV